MFLFLKQNNNNNNNNNPHCLYDKMFISIKGLIINQKKKRRKNNKKKLKIINRLLIYINYKNIKSNSSFLN